MPSDGPDGPRIDPRALAMARVRVRLAARGVLTEPDPTPQRRRTAADMPPGASPAQIVVVACGTEQQVARHAAAALLARDIAAVITRADRARLDPVLGDLRAWALTSQRLSGPRRCDGAAAVAAAFAATADRCAALWRATLPGEPPPAPAPASASASASAPATTREAAAIAASEAYVAGKNPDA